MIGSEIFQQLMDDEGVCVEAYIRVTLLMNCKNFSDHSTHFSVIDDGSRGSALNFNQTPVPLIVVVKLLVLISIMLTCQINLDKRCTQKTCMILSVHLYNHQLTCKQVSAVKHDGSLFSLYQKVIKTQLIRKLNTLLSNLTPVLSNNIKGGY